MVCRKNPDRHTTLRARLVTGPTFSCNSSGTAIAILRASRAYRLARWHRFVSIERRDPLQTALQGTSARAMISRKNPDLPHTALRARLVPSPPLFCNSSDTAIAILRASRAYRLARWHRFVSIALRKPLQTSPQGTSARAMVCRKIADLTQNCHTQPSEPVWCPVPRFPAIHLARQSPFYGPPGHIGSRDD